MTQVARDCLDGVIQTASSADDGCGMRTDVATPTSPPPARGRSTVMSSRCDAPVLRAALQRLHPPTELVEHTRWLFCLSSIAAVGLTSLTVLSDVVTGWSFLLAAVAAATFVASWLHRYRRRRAPLVADLADLVALVLLAAACPRPVLALGVAFPAVWYRAVYGDTRRIVGYGFGVCLALAAGLQVWTMVPGHGAQLAASAVLGNLPVLLLTVFVVRHLAVGLFEREHTQARDAALAALGGQLLGVTDRTAILRTAWATAEAVCAATPGLRTVALHRDGDVLRVHGAAGEFTRPPTTLPGDLLPADADDPVPQRVVPPTALVLSSGIHGEWLGLPMPDSPGSFVLLGGFPTVPHDAVLAVQSMLNQVALALRTSSAHRELRAQALTDRLTGLANRTAFSTAVDAALADPGSEAWVLLLDLDDFKVVNDTLGHLAGDRLLAHLGCELTGTLRAEDLCARLGGDEFAVLLRDAGEAEARRIGQRIVEVISTPVDLGEGLARIGASIGATRVQTGASETLVVHQADVAMYAAKSAGKNRVHFFHPGMLQVADAASAEAELRTAVDGRAPVLALQPVVAAADGRCTAVGALVR